MMYSRFWMPLIRFGRSIWNMKNKNGKRININRTVCRTRLALAVILLRLVNILTSSKFVCDGFGSFSFSAVLKRFRHIYFNLAHSFAPLELSTIKLAVWSVNIWTTSTDRARQTLPLHGARVFFVVSLSFHFTTFRLRYLLLQIYIWAAMRDICKLSIAKSLFCHLN